MWLMSLHKVLQCKYPPGMMPKIALGAGDHWLLRATTITGIMGQQL